MERSYYYNAGFEIMRATALVLRGFELEFEAGDFGCEHPEMPKVKALLESYQEIANEGFTDCAVMASWLHRVADVLDQLWD